MGEKTLYLVVDRSGSMAESSKALIARGLVMEVGQFCRLCGLGYRIQLVSVADSASLVEWGLAQEYPSSLLQCEGSFNMGALRDLLEDKEGNRAILFSDGFWGDSDSKAARRWLKGLEFLKVQVVRVGAESGSFARHMEVVPADDLLSLLEAGRDC